MSLLIGADPELFVKKDGKFASAFGLVPGTKYAPCPVVEGAVQVDGMALEFNIKPAGTQQAFLHSIDMVMAQLRNMVPKEYELVPEAFAVFGEEVMKSQPEEATRLGCDPDFNAYTMCTNSAPLAHPVARAAGGHVHIGYCEDSDPWSEEHFEYCCALAKQMDYYLGLPSVLLDHDKNRKQMYGKAGAFRPKPYGLEYRVLSNFWIRSTELMRRVYDNAVMGYNKFVDGIHLSEEYSDEAQEIINNNDHGRALSLCQEAGIPVGL